MFETCLDLSRIITSKFQLPHCFDNIIDTFSPDYFVLSSTTVFDLFFSNLEENESTVEGDDEDFGTLLELQKKVESFCRSGKLILRIDNLCQVNRLNHILEKCEFLSVPHVIITVDQSSTTPNLQEMSSVFTKKISFEVTKFLDEDDKNNNQYDIFDDKIGFWIDEKNNLNEATTIIPFLLTQNCSALSINSSRCSFSSLNLELVSEFAARGSIFCVCFEKENDDVIVPSFEKMEISISFLSSLIKKIIEEVGMSIQRKAALSLFSFFKNNYQGDGKESRNHHQQQQQKNRNEKSIARDLTLSSTCNDRLQHPLQPLREVLPISTYSEFERDGPKYEEYRKAIDAALNDHFFYSRDDGDDDDDRRNNENGNRNDRIVEEPLAIVILGAGSRGPLLDLVLEKLSVSPPKQKIQIFVIEQNKIAFGMLNLKRRTSSLWKQFSNSMTFVLGDGRDEVNVTSKIVQILSSSSSLWNLLLISELLGSFGDNELSPECIHGFLNSLKISSTRIVHQSSGHLPRNEDMNLSSLFKTVTCIPCRYTSYIAVCSSPKIENEISKLSEKRKGKNNYDQDSSFRHQPYVVKATNIWFKDWKGVFVDGVGDNFPDFISPVFSFDHSYHVNPNLLLSSLELVSSKTTSKFIRRPNNCCRNNNATGLIGFFECDLYLQRKKKRNGENFAIIGKLSTIPTVEKHTPDLYSWFPIYFPLMMSANISAEEEIEVVIERKPKGEEGIFYSWWIQETKDAKRSLSEKMNENGEGFIMEL